MHDTELIIGGVTTVAKSYEGYTSGADDEEFYHVVNAEAQEQLHEIQNTNK